MTPSVSVVVTVHNGEPYLAAAIDSLLAQTLDDFELLIVDDGSTDATPRTLDAFDDPRIVRIENRLCLGQTRSLNVALRRARGEFVARLDADDVALPDRLRQQRAFMLAHPDIALLGSAYELIDQYGSSRGHARMPTECTALRWALHFINPFAHPAVMLRSTALKSVGLYDEAYHWAQDYDLWSRIACVYGVANLPERLTQYRISSTSMSATRAEQMESDVSRIRLRNLARLSADTLTAADAFRLAVLLYRRRRPLSARATSSDVATVLRLHDAFSRVYGLGPSERETHRRTILDTLARRLLVAANQAAKAGDPRETGRFLATASRLGGPRPSARQTASIGAHLLHGMARRIVPRAGPPGPPSPPPSADNPSMSNPG